MSFYISIYVVVIAAVSAMLEGVEADEGFSVQTTTNLTRDFHHQKKGLQSDLMPKELGNYIHIYVYIHV